MSVVVRKNFVAISFSRMLFLIFLRLPPRLILISLPPFFSFRIVELVDAVLRVELTDNRDIVRGSSTLLVSSSKAFVMNSNNRSAKESRDLCVDRLNESFNGLQFGGMAHHSLRYSY